MFVQLTCESKLPLKTSGQHTVYSGQRARLTAAAADDLVLRTLDSLRQNELRKLVALNFAIAPARMRPTSSSLTNLGKVAIAHALPTYFIASCIQ